MSRLSSYQAIFDGNPVKVLIEIDWLTYTTILFTLHGNPFSFVVKNWHGRGFKQLLELFHNVQPKRDTSKFGVMVERTDGTKEFLANWEDTTLNLDGTYDIGPDSQVITQDQKFNIIQQACQDIVTCVNIIGDVYRRSIIEYCIWYIENHINTDTYEKYITMITSQVVIDSVFISPSVSWHLIEFSI